MFKWLKPLLIFNNKRCCKNCLHLHYLQGYYCGHCCVSKRLEDLDTTKCKYKYFKKRDGKFWLYEGAKF